MRRADIEVPNLAVAVNAWARLACYPRGNFYLLIFPLSTKEGRFTNSCFRNSIYTYSSKDLPNIESMTINIIARRISLAVKLAYGFVLSPEFPYRDSQPLSTSVTL